MEQMGRWSERARERFEGSQGRDILSAGLQGGRIGAGRGTSWRDVRAMLAVTAEIGRMRLLLLHLLLLFLMLVLRVHQH